MIGFLKKHALTIAGIPLGILGGYLYYHFYGCMESCTITSSPVNSMLYGALMGGLLLNIVEGEVEKFRKRKQGE